MSNPIDWQAVANSVRLPADADPALAPYIEHIKSQVAPYSGAFSAGWLLTEFEAPIWKTRGKATSKKNGEWKGTEDVSWAQLLPDGQRLTDPSYSALLDTCRRASFFYRQGLAGDLPALLTWQAFNSFLLRMCNWLVLEGARYHPEQYAFALLDNEGVQHIFLALGRGGWTEALRLVERCLDAIHREVIGDPCPAELLTSAHWPHSLRNQVIDWLEANNRYVCAKNAKEHRGLVSRTWLGSLGNISPQSLSGAPGRLNLFLRQFEPQWQHPTLLLSSYCQTEYPSHRVPLLGEAELMAGYEGALHNSLGYFTSLFKFFRHLPDVLPDPTWFRLKDAERAAYRYTKPKGHTPFIPVDIGLAYLNESLRWVWCYGDALVDYYLTVYERRESKRARCGAVCNIKEVDEALFASTPLPETLKLAGFQFRRFTTLGNRAFGEWRNAPTLQEALEIWVGAVTVLLGLTKPARDTEIRALPRNCLLRTRGGHYWLDADLAKRSKAEVRARTGGKPIPQVAARAIQQVRKLNRGLVRINEEPDQHLREKLFYLPNAKRSRSGMMMDRHALNHYLDHFCDYVNLPPDSYGRRWYLRIHEMRKWFLLLLFWLGRYDVLDATRWIAGHTDVAHLYAYIEREFPGGKIGELEAECAIDLLAQYDETRVLTDSEEVGLVELHRQVLQHFHVKRLNLVREREWRGLVKELFEQDYHLEPITLTTRGDQKHVCIAIRQGSRRAY